jgi:hypothetical protein
VNTRFVVTLAIASLLLGRAAAAQSVEPPIPAAPAAAALPAAGVIPPGLTLDVTGSPAADGNVIYAKIQAALDRAIRPTLRPGAGLRYGAVNPWPLLPLAPGARTAVNVTTTIAGDGTTVPVSGTTTVTVENVPFTPARPHVLFLSDDPEYLMSDGLVFRGTVTAEQPARMYYYHSDIGMPRDVDVVLTASAPARVHLLESAAGPDLDVMSVGHTVSRDLLRYQQSNQGTVVDVGPGQPFVVRHSLILQGEVVAGAIDMHVVSGGAVAVSVVAAPAGSRPETFLNGPRVAFDGHNRHGVFDLTSIGIMARSYTAGGPDVAVQYANRTATPRNVDAADPGHDFGDYGVVHNITFSLDNPTDTAYPIYLYEKPLGGPVRSSFVVDGQLKELGCARVPKPYLVAQYQLPAHSTGATTTVTMTDGGSFYPLEYGVTSTQPVPYTPPVGAPDGCSANVPAFNEPTS